METAVADTMAEAQRGGVVILAADQSVPKESIRVPFFGREVPTAKGPAALSLKAGVPIYLCRLRRVADGSHRGDLTRVSSDGLDGYSETNVIELTKKLISLPSYDDGNLYERPMSDFLVAYVRERLPWLNVTQQEVAPNRFNVLLQDEGKTRLLIVDQIDTVVPDAGWTTNPLDAIEREGKIFGLGASDSKGNVASLLKALEANGPTRGLAVLLYVDEEYFFKGMNQFVGSTLARSIDPQWILSVDGNGSSLGTGCRGLVEFDLELRSASGHSANPQTSGVLRPFLKTLRSFEDWLVSYKDDQQGVPTCNVARLQSGLLVREDTSRPDFGEQGNRIPNFLQAKQLMNLTL